MGIKKDYKLLNWEQNDFPITCDKCLGESKVLRMLKKPLGAECRICTRPFTVFKWATQAGSARQKKTEICSTCAKINDCCQVCVHDLKFGLPLEIRNKMLGDQKVDLLMSEGNRDIFAHLANEQIDSLKLPYEKLEAISQSQNQVFAEKDVQETEVVIDPTNIRRLIQDKYLKLEPEQRGVIEAYELANKIVGKQLTRDSKQVSIWFVEESELPTVRAKIEDLFSDPFELSFENKVVILTFENRVIAEKFIRVFNNAFVIKGKLLSLDWHVEGSRIEDKLKDSFFGVVTDEFLPKEPNTNLLKRREQMEQ